MIIIGLTGSIAMGKSTIAAMFENEGVPVHDADAAVHRLLAPDGSGFAPVTAAFDDIVGADGQIDRQALGRAVFGNDENVASLKRSCIRSSDSTGSRRKRCRYCRSRYPAFI